MHTCDVDYSDPFFFTAPTHSTKRFFQEGWPFVIINGMSCHVKGVEKDEVVSNARISFGEAAGVALELYRFYSEDSSTLLVSCEG